MSNLETAKVLAAAGLIRPVNPLAAARAVAALRSWGVCLAGGFTAAALRSPRRIAVSDERGTLTFAQLDQRSNALADSLRRLGVEPGGGIAILCRNHRGFIEAILAAAKLGADALLLNTSFAGPQLAGVVLQEKPTVLIHDQEFTDQVAGIVDIVKVHAWVNEPDPSTPYLDDLIERGSVASHTPPARTGRIVILTSGTTGAPKGAPRREAALEAAVALLSKLPVKANWRVHIATPLFHTWGLAHFLLSMLLQTTTVLTRRFEPGSCLELLSSERIHEVVVAPVMLQQILRLPESTRRSYDLSALRVVASSGSALPGDLATEWMDAFGDNLYNTYGSTEVGYATIATPGDLRAAPGTAGRPPVGAVVRLYDTEDKPSRPDRSGRIFVGNCVVFDGYTDGTRKPVIDGLTSTGDIGRFDEDGRLFIEGREDDMIISGGENVFPQEIEDCLTRHALVLDAAVLGVADDIYGTRIKAFVVPVGPGAVTVEELKEHVGVSLARYKVPRDVEFLEELPRNATGKLLKRVLSDNANP